MKNFFWTTIFWLIVFFGFAFYMKTFNANMAAGVSTWLGSTTITTSGETIPTGTGTITVTDVMSGVFAIQTTLTDMQAKLDTLVGTTSVVPTVTPTVAPVITPTVTPSASLTGK